MGRATSPLVLACVAGCFALTACRATQPGKLESNMAQWTKKHVTVRGKTDRDPLADTPQTIADGKTAFGHYCIVCHGLDGQNTGVPFANSVDPPVPSLASKEVQSYTDGQLKWIIENGVAPSGMPGSHGILNDDEIWSIVRYLRHLPPAGSLGEPKVYSGEENDDDQK